MKLSDEFTATDPDTNFEIKLKKAKDCDVFWLWEYGSSSPMCLHDDTVRALIQYGRDQYKKERKALYESKSRS